MIFKDGWLRMKAWMVMAVTVMGVQSSVQGQVANSDFYTATAGLALSVAAPGVLGNDTGSGSLTAALVTGPANGTLTFNADGSFVYTPTNNFTGMDGFTYRARTTMASSSPASVDIMVLGPGELFHDDFSRPTNNGSIFPWTLVSGYVGVGTWGISNVSGTWGITNGLMRGTGTNYCYGYTYNGNTNWTDYSVEGQFRFSRNSAASAGILGRLNPVTGAHYAVWIYPEQSDEYNVPPLNGIPRLWLYKYESWTSYTSIGQWSSLPAVGTNWHTLKLAFQGSNIFAYFDGTLVTNATDDGSLDGQPAYTNGSMGLNLWISTTPYIFSVDNLIVRTPVASTANAADDTYAAAAATGPTLYVPAPGILANDTGSGTLTALLVSGPANGNLTLTNNGGFSYTPTNNFVGIDSFTYQCKDGTTTSGVATVTLTVSNLVFDLAIGKSGAATIPATSNLAYTISVTNNGPAGVSSVTVTDALPAGVGFVSASGNWATNNGLVTWSLGTLASGQVSNLTLTIAAPVSGTLTNAASVGPLLNDSNPANNMTPPVLTTVTPVADVGLGNTGPAGVVYGTSFNYTISVTNLGPSTAAGLSVTDTVPAGLVFVAASANWTTNGSQVVWTNLGSLASGKTTNLTLTVQSTSSGIATNLAGGSSSTTDPNPANNTAPPVVTTITKALPIVTWLAPANIVYGTPLSTNQNDATSSVPGNFVYNPTNGTVLTVRTNALQAVYTPLDTNYATTNLSVPLVVMPALVRVSADDKTRLYSLTNPVLTASYNGFVNNENANVLSGSPALSTPANSASPAGDYPIAVALGTLSNANYSFFFTNGTLRVTPAPVPVITSFGLTNGAANLTWTSFAGATYRVQAIDNLSGTNWSDMASDVMASGSTVTQTNLPGNVIQRYYRVWLRTL
jgi:uncharacterized repeat protein (TIGR01451 family)